MFRNHTYQHAFKFCLILIVLTAITTGCNTGKTQKPVNNQIYSFQLFIFSASQGNSLSYQATQLEYQDWLNKVDLSNAEFVIDSTFVSSFSMPEAKEHSTLSLELNSEASEKIVRLLEPNSEITSVLNGEYSIGCFVYLSSQKAFVISIQGERIVGGILRCPTQPIYRPPEMYTTSQQGKVFLEIRNTTKSIYDEITVGLEK